MDDFFRKVNVLVRAGVTDLLSGNRAGRRAADAPRPDKLGGDADRELAALRARINQALDYEDELRARVNALQAESARWDAQTDAFIQGGQDESARYAAAQFRSAQQRSAMAEADLREHQLVTQELILRVNELDAAVADARQREGSAGAEAETLGERTADILRDMRAKAAELGEMISARAAPPGAGAAQDAPQGDVDSQAVEDDLARRRDRLSRK